MKALNVLDYVNAGRRGFIFEELGCTSHIYLTIVWIATTSVPLLLAACASCAYGGASVIFDAIQGPIF